MSEPPMVTVAVPCLDEIRHIAGCLGAILDQDYPAHRLEIIVADGGSTDGTRELLRRFAEAEPRIRVVDNEARVQAAGLNAILRACRGDVIVRMDVHCDYAPDYVRTSVEVLARTGADCVGGPQRVVARGRFEAALSAALRSPLGMGGARHRQADREGLTDTVFLGAFRREVFERVGLFDPGAVTNEDAELNQRILAAGGRIYQSRDIVSRYTPRDSFRRLMQQYFAYGAGRARTLVKHGRLTVTRPLIPFLFVTGGAALVLTSPFHALTPLCLGLYALIALVEGIRVGGRAAPLVARMFPVMHVAHGVGFAAGLIRYLRRPDWRPPERLAPRRDPAAAARAQAG